MKLHRCVLKTNNKHNVFFPEQKMLRRKKRFGNRKASAIPEEVCTIVTFLIYWHVSVYTCVCCIIIILVVVTFNSQRTSLKRTKF